MEHYFSRLEDAIRKHWDDKGLCNYNGEEFTYGQMAACIARLHLLFEELGVKKGDKIALSAKNSARWGISFLAINTYGAVVVPILNDFLPESIAHLTGHSESVLLFTDKEIWDKVPDVEKPKLKGVVNVSDFSFIEGSDKLRKAIDDLDSAFDKKYPEGYKQEYINYPKDNVMDLAVINYTSGTTSAPKGVMLRYECFISSIQFAVDKILPKKDDCMVSMLPMGHIYGLVFEFLYPVCTGATVYFLGRTPSPTLLLKALKEKKPFLIITVPLVMEKIFKSGIKPVISRFPLNILTHIPGISRIIYRKIGRELLGKFGGKVRIIIMGGAALNPDVEKVFEKMGLPYTIGYGMTEAAPIVCWDLPGEYTPGTCGRPVFCNVVKIDSKDPLRIPGEILVKGTNICSGYYNNPEASRDAFTEDGYLRTGDLGITDRKGNVIIKGRCKTMILSANGQNIYPEEVESIVNSQPYVTESVVVDRNSKLVALVLLDNDAIRKAGLDAESVARIPEDIMAVSNKQLPAYSHITKIELVDKPFEKTPKMSIKRFLYN